MTETDFLKHVLLGRTDAVEFCTMLGELSQTWDDLIDGTFRELTDVNSAFLIALFGIRENSFFQRHESELVPLMKAAIHDWLDANVLERGTPNDKVLAYVLRDSLTSLVVQVARIIGGTAYAREVGADIRRHFHDEPLADYLRGLRT